MGREALIPKAIQILCVIICYHVEYQSYQTSEVQIYRFLGPKNAVQTIGDT